MEVTVLLICAYLIGNLLMATVIGKLLFRQDIRLAGSGNPGARNAGRVFGKTGFVLTFIGDAVKGAAVVSLARWLGMDEWLQLVCLIAVMAGHIYPIVHKFRGGQGVSTFIGGMLSFNPIVVASFVVVFLIFYPFLKNFSLVGLSAMALSPLFLFGLTKEWPQTVAAILVVALLLFAHRKDFPCRKRVYMAVRRPIHRLLVANDPSNRERRDHLMKEIRSIEEWEQVRSQSNKEPVLLMKHSSTCPISAAGYREFERFETEIPKYYLIVQRSRRLSNEIESELSIQHESPQLFLLKDGEAAWHASHYKISQSNLKAAVQANG
ncbi:bacillithiol system redox-active protein YtxJ [Sporosarcina luteola]|uniref:bacillithiol system redox-active protein YtxJ n=1 Tax=Bacillales TaxID=1385 RepID=UPI00203FE554|nr:MULTISPECIES: bacillithiol system redox-active protein YtxJ [Bacillales]MCM3638622.1 bacillithiol system redox-active protein YtxJ [Sporosarcina luteola]